ncbi:MAG: NAD(P)-binding domain-containing protein [Bacteroidales bacterium]|nr:NAD(P)-binding domain-containing protein [Bacteroidales bacterium]
MKIVLIGAGNVATHIGKALFNEGHKIEQIFSRTMKSALELASKFNTSFTTDIKTITDNGDIYIIAISDIAIPSIIQAFPHKDKLLIHTAGSVDISVFERVCKAIWGNVSTTDFL